MPQGYSGLPPFYLQSSDPITANLGLSLKGCDPIVAENFYLIDTAFGSVGGTVDVNGTPVPNPNFVNSATAVFSVVGSNISITASGGGHPGGSPTQIQFNNTGVFGGIAGSSADGVNGLLSLSATGTGVPLS